MNSYAVATAGLSLLLSTTIALAGSKIGMDTSLGSIVLELEDEKAPKTVENFLRYAGDGHYDGTVFHRVIANFMIQGGGFTADFQHKATRAPIMNEADNGLKNKRGTIAMARTSDPNSATSQFFINVKDNDFLDFKAPTPPGWGYAVFGRVIEGMDVVDKISRLPTGPGGMFPKDVPQTAVVINKMTIIPAPSISEKAQRP